MGRCRHDKTKCEVCKNAVMSYPEGWFYEMVVTEWDEEGNQVGGYFIPVDRLQRTIEEAKVLEEASMIEFEEPIELEVPVRVVKVDCECSECEKGTMQFTGSAFFNLNSFFEHECTNCGHHATFKNRKYPRIRYRNVR